LKSKGLWTLLGSQLRLVRGTAFSGIAQIANLSIEDIRIKLSNLDNQSIVFDEVFQHLEKIKETTGLYFIDEEKTVLI
ncbi:MAG TPA: hypothetical protein VEQ34_09655, partial [Pyrinomonadaceae bacterium]|nr:hypothetical protein [Pyrinomonadaceae bacterium]